MNPRDTTWTEGGGEGCMGAAIIRLLIPLEYFCFTNIFLQKINTYNAKLDSKYVRRLSRFHFPILGQDSRRFVVYNLFLRGGGKGNSALQPFSLFTMRCGHSRHNTQAMLPLSMV